MGFQFYKRVRVNENIGLNLSKAGISMSFRSRFGSISPKGFTLKTGIPGFSVRSSFKNTSPKGLVNFLLFILLLGLLVLSVIIIWNVLLIFYWVVTEGFHAIQRAVYKARIKRIINNNNYAENFTFFRFSETSLPLAKGEKACVSNVLVENGAIVDPNTEIATIQVNERLVTVNATKSGRVIFCKFPGEKLNFGEYFFLIEHN